MATWQAKRTDKNCRTTYDTDRIVILDIFTLAAEAHLHVEDIH